MIGSSGSFGSLQIAKSGLEYQQIAIDTANNNISNIDNPDYVRRSAVGEEVGGPQTPVMWSQYTGVGEGVTTGSIQRLTDALTNQRVRTETGNLAYLTAQQSAMTTVETGTGEPGDNGVSAALNDFVQSWQTAVTNPGSTGSTSGPAARESVIAAGETLASAINTQARNVVSQANTEVTQASNDVSQINTDAQELAKLNNTIYLAQSSGTETSDLEDQRDAIALDLSKLSGATVTQQADGRMTASINGVAIVGYNSTDGDWSGTLQLSGTTQGTQASLLDQNGDWTGAGLSYEIETPTTTNPASNIDQVIPQTVQVGSTGIGGDLGGVVALLAPTAGGNSSLADYMNGLNAVAEKLVDVVNSVYANGYDADGNVGTQFFDVGAAATATTTLANGNTQNEFDTTTWSMTDDSNNPGSPTGSTNGQIPWVGNGAALNISVDSALQSDPDLLALSATPGSGNYDTTNAENVYQALQGGTLSYPNGYPTPQTATPQSLNMGSQYSALISGLGTAVNALNSQASNQQSLTTQVVNEQQQETGVSLDEETINLMQAERAYQASSRVLSTMDDVLNTLINGTGVAS